MENEKDVCDPIDIVLRTQDTERKDVAKVGISNSC